MIPVFEGKVGSSFPPFGEADFPTAPWVQKTLLAVVFAGSVAGVLSNCSGWPGKLVSKLVAFQVKQTLFVFIASFVKMIQVDESIFNYVVSPLLRSHILGIIRLFTWNPEAIGILSQIGSENSTHQ